MYKDEKLSQIDMTVHQVFQLIKPVLEAYIKQKHELTKQIFQDGTLPEDVIAECPYHGIIDVKKFDDKTRKASKNFVKWILDNKISRIESNTKNIYFCSEFKKVEGWKGEKTIDSILMSREEGLKENQVVEYGFKFSLSNLKKKDFFKILSNFSFQNLQLCEHLDENVLMDANPLVINSKDSSRFFHHDYDRTLGEVFRKSNAKASLQLYCDDCYRRIDHLCCTDSIIKYGVGYELNPGHPVEGILLKLNLKKHNLDFTEFEYSDRNIRRTNQFFLKKHNALLSQKYREIDNVIEKIKPEILILQGNKQDIIDYLKYDVDLIIFDDSEDAKQRFFLFDKNKKIEEDIEKCCLHIIQNLEPYSDEIRGKEHDKLIGALEKIGKDLGYIPQREISSKGSRVDLVWLDRNGKIFSALEVETASQWKKDIVTTWETEPKLAVILAHYKSEKGIKDIVQYILLKDMPHKLLFINNVTKKAYLVEKQNILKYYDIEKQEEIASDVFEY